MSKVRIAGGFVAKGFSNTRCRFSFGSRWITNFALSVPRALRLFSSMTLILLATLVRAAPGDVDLSFDPGSGVDGTIYSIAVQSDGKVLIGGDFTTVKGLVRNRIARLNADGSGDNSFNPGTGANFGVRSVVVQPDGKVLIGGGFTTVNGLPRNSVARLNSDGSLDTGFNPGAGANGGVRSIALQTDGKVLIGGGFFSVNGIGRNRIARLNANGSLDTSFDPGSGATGGIDATVLSVALQADDKVIIGGGFSSVNGTNRYFVARLNADGSLDTSFNPETVYPGFSSRQVSSAALQPDGKILIGGYFTTANGSATIARLNTNGVLDASFNPGTGANDVYSVAMQTDGKVLIAGLFTAVNGISRNRVARLNANGSLDTSFNPGTATTDSVNVNVLALQTDGKVLIGGAFTSVNSASRHRIERLNGDGALDSSFVPGTGANNDVRAVAVQPDSKVLIGGVFVTVNGVGRNRIARLHGDGSLDASFNPGTGANSHVYSVAFQPDGKVVIGGVFTAVNGTNRNRIARLNADGSLDTSFNPGTGANDEVDSIAVLADGKMLIGGGFTGVNGISRGRIARLNANGSVDGSFNPGAGTGGILNPFVYSVAVRADGKAVIGGNFTSVNGTIRNYIARLNADGSLDTSFNPGTGANSDIRSVAVQTDGKVIIGGNFTLVNGINRSRIARLHPDGSLDTGFNPGLGANNTVFSLALQSDGKVIIGGDFFSGSSGKGVGFFTGAS